MSPPIHPRVIAGAVFALLVVAETSPAALTTAKCLVSKNKAWSTLSKCQAAEQARRIALKEADLAKCTTKLQDALAKINAKAAKAAIACRYRDNGDLTVTNFDTGLMWERKIETIPLQGLPCAIVNAPSCVTRAFTWFTAMTDFLTELRTIRDRSAPGCDEGGTCIDPIFGPTAAAIYWTSSTEGPSSSDAWCIAFDDGDIENKGKGVALRARAVRNGL